MYYVWTHGLESISILLFGKLSSHEISTIFMEGVLFSRGKWIIGVVGNIALLRSSNKMRNV